MPEIEISIGGRHFEVACQEGEEHFLTAAAQLLDNEATTLTSQIGRLGEGRLLLMAGLMLADKMSGINDKQNELVEKIAMQDQLIGELRAQAEQTGGPTDALRALVAQAEILADDVERAVS